MYCRNCGNQMDNNASVCVRCGVRAGVGQSFCPNCGAETVQGAAVCTRCGFGLGGASAAGGGQKSKMAAGLLGIFLGGLGIHNFYLGNTTRGLIQLLVALIGGPLTLGLGSIAMGIWGLVEGIMILTGSINTDGKGMPLKD